VLRELICYAPLLAKFSRINLGIVDKLFFIIFKRPCGEKKHFQEIAMILKVGQEGEPLFRRGHVGVSYVDLPVDIADEEVYFWLKSLPDDNIENYVIDIVYLSTEGEVQEIEVCKSDTLRFLGNCIKVSADRVRISPKLLLALMSDEELWKDVALTLEILRRFLSSSS